MDASPKIYGLTFIEQPYYLHVRLTVPIDSREMAMSILSEVMNRCADRRHKRVLLEREIEEKVSDDQLFEALCEMVEMDSGTRVAFLDRHLTDNDCSQLTGTDCQCFQRKDEAETWLLQDD